MIEFKEKLGSWPLDVSCGEQLIKRMVVSKWIDGKGITDGPKYLQMVITPLGLNHLRRLGAVMVRLGNVGFTGGKQASIWDYIKVVIAFGRIGWSLGYPALKWREVFVLCAIATAVRTRMRDLDSPTMRLTLEVFEP